MITARRIKAKHFLLKKILITEADDPPQEPYKATLPRNFLGGPVVKNPPVNTKDMGSIPGQGRFHMPRGN